MISSSVYNHGPIPVEIALHAHVMTCPWPGINLGKPEYEMEVREYVLTGREYDFCQFILRKREFILKQTLQK